jgi:hypothetical protein
LSSVCGVRLTSLGLFSSLKDRAYSVAHPDRISVQLLCLAEYEWFEAFAHEKSGSRSDEYVEMKRQWQERMLAVLFQRFPQLRDRLDVRVCVRACVRVCVRACVRVCVRACVRACVRVCV